MVQSAAEEGRPLRWSAFLIYAERSFGPGGEDELHHLLRLLGHPASAEVSSFGPRVYAIIDGVCRYTENEAREAMGGVGGDILISHARNEDAQLKVAC